ncbi:hypothetical protein [Limoniibacter endophyticus]|uniref:Uncharacterized protein n=1 Tax=Limoniibacter endophyticus TaxID=1565040 RepID=A0A8J3GI78_9HYPH|nr:hypothetical protein [Limoniibacter endophyticus]GHC79637.1 hypothetical protein GCM10010136_32370 [Limoniibacter endophyticus]
MDKPLDEKGIEAARKQLGFSPADDIRIAAAIRAYLEAAQAGESEVPKHVENAMRAKRRELIAIPLERAWPELARVAVEAMQAGESEAAAEPPIAAHEGRDVDWKDVTGWGVFNGHAIPVAVARKIAERINLYHTWRSSTLKVENERLREQLVRMVDIAEARLILLTENNVPDVSVSAALAEQKGGA